MRPLVTYWPGKVHDVVKLTEDPGILILGGLTPFGVGVVYRLNPGNFGLLSSVRPSGVFYGG